MKMIYWFWLLSQNFLLFVHSSVLSYLVSPFQLCFLSSDLTPSYSLFPPHQLSTLYTSSRWGNQSACYSLISDTIRVLILAPVSRCRGQSWLLPGWASELLSGTTSDAEWALSQLLSETDCRNKDSHADRFSSVTKVLSGQILSAGVWWCVLAAQKISYSSQTLINKHNMAPTRTKGVCV